MLLMELKREDFASDDQELSRNYFQQRKSHDTALDDDEDDNDNYARERKSYRALKGWQKRRGTFLLSSSRP